MDSNVGALQQTEMLREIRDELRTSRLASNIGGGPGGYHGDPMHGRSFVQSQLATDRAISGQWGNFSWAAPHRSQIQSSLMNDILGATGMKLAPTSMTQLEYQQLSSESWRHRVGTYMGSIIAPEHVARTNALAQDLYANSHRFVRYGDPGAGIMGSGLSFSASLTLAQQIQRAGTTDFRGMNAQDYTTIAMGGLKSGQFDFTPAREFIDELGKMAKTVSTLNRTLHTETAETVQALGNLRRMGVVDIADQQRTMTRVGAAAQVAGMSFGDIMSAATPSMQLGLQMGIGVQGTAAASALQMASLRELSRGGLVSGTTMAQGGGIEGLSQRIMQTQMGFATSNFGYYSMLGGGTMAGANSYEALRRGMSETFGKDGLQGFLNAELVKSDVIDKWMAKDPDALNRGFVNSVGTQLKWMGYKSNTADGAEGAAFQMLRRMTGDDASARVLARENFSQEGVQARKAALWKAAEAEGEMDLKAKHDDYNRATSFAGAWDRAGKSFSTLGQDAANWFTNMSSSNTVAQTSRAVLRNKGVGLNIYSSGRELDNSVFLDPDGDSNIKGPVLDNIDRTRIIAKSGAFFTTAGKLAGGAGGASLAGTAGGGLLGIGAGYLGMKAVGILGSMVDASLGLSGDIELEGQKAANFSIMSSDEEKKKVSAADRKEILSLLNQDEAWKNYRRTGKFGAPGDETTGGKLDAAGTDKWLNFAGERVMDMRRRAGGGLWTHQAALSVISETAGVQMAEGLSDASSAGQVLSDEKVSEYTKSIKDTLYHGISASDMTNIDLSSTETLKAQDKMIKAMQSGDTQAIEDASKELGVAIGTHNVDQFKKNASRALDADKIDASEAADVQLDSKPNSLSHLGGQTTALINNRNIALRKKVFQASSNVAATLLEQGEMTAVDKGVVDSLRKGSMSIGDLMNQELKEGSTLDKLIKADSTGAYGRAKSIHDMDEKEFDKVLAGGAQEFTKRFGGGVDAQRLFESAKNDGRYATTAQKKKLLENKLLMGGDVMDTKAAQDKMKKETMFESALTVLKALEERLKPK